MDTLLCEFPDMKQDAKHLTPMTRSSFKGSFQNLLMQLRKCCNHPYLFCYPPEDSLSVVSDSGKMIVLLQLLQALKSRHHRTLVFSQMSRVLDLIEEALEGRRPQRPGLQCHAPLQLAPAVGDRVAEGQHAEAALVGVGLGGQGAASLPARPGIAD